ncbi:hypothetical protein F5879DRAFT_975648 [Lentinula edodes]|nr:hypothetical protein F5879DRAFT_975648 [Lentinula edodes]
MITHGSATDLRVFSCTFPEVLGFALTGIMTNVLLDANDSPTILATAFVVRGFITGACFLPTWYSSEQVVCLGSLLKNIIPSLTFFVKSRMTGIKF